MKPWSPSSSARLWTVEECLLLERSSSVKHEDHGGNIDALAAGSPAHSVIAGNIVTLHARACAVAVAAGPDLRGQRPVP